MPQMPTYWSDGHTSIELRKFEDEDAAPGEPDCPTYSLTILDPTQHFAFYFANESGLGDLFRHVAAIMDGDRSTL